MRYYHLGTDVINLDEILYMEFIELYEDKIKYKVHYSDKFFIYITFNNYNELDKFRDQLMGVEDEPTTT